MDVIDRQAAINVIQAGRLTKLIDADTAINGLKGLPSAHPEPQWISCSERLPKESGQYYVSGGDEVWICDFLIIPTFIGGWCNDVVNPVVQAWMPLPKPYKGGEQDE